MASHASLLDKSISINEENWAVTMICNSNSSGKPATSSFGNNHALLAVEGVEKSGTVFRMYIHLMGPAFILRETDIQKHEEFHKNKAPFNGICCSYGMQRMGIVEVKTIKLDYKYTHKSETWLRSAEKVRVMLHQAELEQKLPAQYPRPFTILGNKSVFASDLETFRITDPLIVAIANSDKSLFLKLYDIAIKCRDNYTGLLGKIDSRGIERLRDNYFYPGSILGTFGWDAARDWVENLWKYGVKESKASAWQSFNAKWNISGVENVPVAWCNLITKSRMKEIQELFAQTKTPEERQQLISMASEAEKEFFTEANARIEKKLQKYNETILGYSDRIQKLLDKIIHEYPKLTDKVKEFVKNFNSNPLKTYRDLLYTIYEHTDLRPITPDSCFTWATEKLSIIDVKIAEKGFESFVSPTKAYLNPVHERNWISISSDIKDEKK